MRVNTFQRAQSELAALIARYQPGDKLPSEPKLAEQMGVSRATLREAMRTFETQGILRRRQGAGTFIAAHVPVLETGLEVLESIEHLARQRGLQVSMGALQVEQKVPPEDVGAALGLEDGQPALHVSRVIHTQGRPAAFLVDILPLDALSPEDLQPPAFSGSVLDFFLRRGQPPLITSRAEITAIGAPSAVAQALDIQRGDVLLHLIAQLYDADGRVVDYSHSYFLPGIFRFHVLRKVVK